MTSVNYFFFAVQYQALDAVERWEFAPEPQLALDLKESFDERHHRREQHRVSLTHKFVAES